MTTLTSRSVFRPAAVACYATVALICCSAWTAVAQSDEPGVLSIGSPDGSAANYTLSDGTLNTSGTYVGPQSRFDQFGGFHDVAGNLLVEGGVTLKGGGVAYAFYTITGGFVAAESTSVVIGVFTQSGGTNVSGELTIGPHNAQCTFNLSGGRVETVNTFLNGSWQGGFKQTGGSHIVANRLTLVGDDFQRPLYVLNEGELESPQIEITKGTLRHVAGTIRNSELIALNEAVLETGGDVQFGKLRLLGSGVTNSVLRLNGTVGVVRFDNSRDAMWDSDATLVIEEWNGAFQGGGAEQVLVGTDSTALTAEQLAKIVFRNPGSCATGVYPARLLPNGELAPGPYLNNVVQGGERRLEWDGNYVLQSAASPAGPFEDVIGAASPYVPDAVEAQRFFRLRK